MTYLSLSRKLTKAPLNKGGWGDLLLPPRNKEILLKQPLQLSLTTDSEGSQCHKSPLSPPLLRGEKDSSPDHV